MMFKNLVRHIATYYPLSPVAAGTGDTQTSSAIDLQNAGTIAEAVLCTVKFGTITATGTGVVKLQHSSDDGSTDAYADIAGSGYTYTAAVDSGKAVQIDLYRPVKRYLKIIVTRATANVVIDNGQAIVYHQETQPSASSTVTSIKVLNSPVSGTA